jgi:hypothetical protein
MLRRKARATAGSCSSDKSQMPPICNVSTTMLTERGRGDDEKLTEREPVADAERLTVALRDTVREAEAVAVRLTDTVAVRLAVRLTEALRDTELVREAVTVPDADDETAADPEEEGVGSTVAGGADGSSDDTAEEGRGNGATLAPATEAAAE